MNIKTNGVIKNFSYSFLANATNTLISMILVLIVPKLIGVKEYSYWQLYLFYTSYVGFFHFGWADGIYLKFGGKKYEEIDKNYFNTQFWLLTFMEILVAILLGIGTMILCRDADKSFILVMTGLCCVLQIPRTFLQYILQATNRIADYAKNYFLEKIVYAILVAVFLIVGVRDYNYLIGSDLFARMVTLLLLVYQCRDIVFKKISRIGQGIKDAWDNISIGSKLLFANIASLLLVGIVRFAIENYWGVETFGRVSLSVTASNLLMVLINAVSVVLYPMLKNIPEDRYVEMYDKMKVGLMVPVLGMLVVYYPAKVILSWWLPQYAESLRYMALLFPICVFESKNSMIVNTYLKALRKEKFLMRASWFAVGVSLVCSAVFVYILHDLNLSIACIPVILGVRCYVGEAILAKELKVNIWKDVLVEIGLVVVFILVSWNVESMISTLVYLCCYLIYVKGRWSSFADIFLKKVKK